MEIKVGGITINSSDIFYIQESDRPGKSRIRLWQDGGPGEIIELDMSLEELKDIFRRAGLTIASDRRTL